MEIKPNSDKRHHTSYIPFPSTNNPPEPNSLSNYGLSPPIPNSRVSDLSPTQLRSPPSPRNGRVNKNEIIDQIIKKIHKMDHPLDNSTHYNGRIPLCSSKSSNASRPQSRSVSYTHLRAPRDKRQSRMPSSA